MADETRNSEGLTAEAEFAAELHPRRTAAGSPARVTVENRNNALQIFTLTWRSPEDELDFEPHPTQQLHIPPREVAMASFSVKPRSRPLFGGEQVLPFTTHVQAAGGEVQNLIGEVVAKPLIPTWVPIAALAALVVCACLVIGGAGVLGILDRAQSDEPAATAPAAEQLPAEQPTQPPAEQPAEPAATAAPVEGQPTQPPVAEQLPEEPPSAEQQPQEPGTSGLPCVPFAGVLVLGPLLAIGKRGGNWRRSNR